MQKSPVLPTMPWQGGGVPRSSQDGAQASTEPQRPEILIMQAVNRSSTM